MVESKTNEINVAKYIIKQTPIGHLSQALELLNIVCVHLSGLDVGVADCLDNAVTLRLRAACNHLHRLRS